MSGTRLRRKNADELSRAATCSAAPRTVRAFLATEGKDRLSLELVAAALAGYAASASSEIAGRLADIDDDTPLDPGWDDCLPRPRVVSGSGHLDDDA